MPFEDDTEETSLDFGPADQTSGAQTIGFSSSRGAANPYTGQLQALLTKYLENSERAATDKQALLDKARERVMARSAGPDQAEMAFRLAAALGKPTRTGGFGEALGNVAETTGEALAQRRKATQELEDLNLKYQLAAADVKGEGQKAQINALSALARSTPKDRLTEVEKMQEVLEDPKSSEGAKKNAQARINYLTTRGGGSSEIDRIVSAINDPNTTPAAKKAYEARLRKLTYIAPTAGEGNKPASPAGKLALDEGLTPGTPEYQKRVKALAGEGKGLNLTATEQKELFEAEDIVNSSKSVILNLNKAKEISPKAYTGFGAGARRTVARNIPGVSESEGVTSTTELETLVGQNALDQLKAIFGGAPTEGERKILLDLQGSLSMSDAERQKLFDRAITAAARRLKTNQTKMENIRKGAYGRITPEADAAGGLVGRYADGGSVEDQNAALLAKYTFKDRDAPTLADATEADRLLNKYDWSGTSNYGNAAFIEALSLAQRAGTEADKQAQALAWKYAYSPDEAAKILSSGGTEQDVQIAALARMYGDTPDEVKFAMSRGIPVHEHLAQMESRRRGVPVSYASWADSIEAGRKPAEGSTAKPLSFDSGLAANFGSGYYSGQDGAAAQTDQSSELADMQNKYLSGPENISTYAQSNRKGPQGEHLYFERDQVKKANGGLIRHYDNGGSVSGAGLSPSQQMYYDDLVQRSGQGSPEEILNYVSHLSDVQALASLAAVSGQKEALAKMNNPDLNTANYLAGYFGVQGPIGIGLGKYVTPTSTSGSATTGGLTSVAAPTAQSPLAPRSVAAPAKTSVMQTSSTSPSPRLAGLQQRYLSGPENISTYSQSGAAGPQGEHMYFERIPVRKADGGIVHMEDGGLTLANMGRAVGQGLGLGFGDEAIARVRAKMEGRPYEDVVKEEREAYQQFQEKHPFAALGTELVSGAVPTIGMAMIPGAGTPGAAMGAGRMGMAASKLTQYLPKFMTGTMGKAAGTAAATGAVAGAGSETEGNRGTGAMTGAATGAVLGPTVAKGLQLAGQGVKAVKNAIRPSPGTVEQRATNKVLEAMGRDEMDIKGLKDRMAADRAMGVKSTVMDATPSLSTLGEAVVTRPGSGRKILGQGLNERLESGREAAGARALKDIGKGVDYTAQEDSLVGKLRANANNLYDQAYAHGSVDDTRIQKVLEDDTFKSAFKEAQRIAGKEARAAELRGEDPSRFKLNDIYEVDKDGNLLSVGKIPDVRTLDYIKRGIDALIDKGYRGEGMGKAEANALKDLKKAFVNVIDENVPEYATARAKYAGDMEVLDALRFGRTDYLTPKMLPAEAKKLVDGMSDAERDALRAGVAQSLLTKVMDAPQQVNAAQRIIGAPATRKRLEALFEDPNEYKVFEAALQRESELFRNAQDIVRGSRTANKTEALKDLKAGNGIFDIAGEAMDVAAGSPGSVVGRVLKYLQARTSLDEKTANEVAKMLKSGSQQEVDDTLKRLESSSAKFLEDKNTSARRLKTTSGAVGAAAPTTVKEPSEVETTAPEESDDEKIKRLMEKYKTEE